MPAIVLEALQLLPLLVQAGTDMVNFSEWLISVIKGGDPTDDDWAKLHAFEDAARARLNDTSKDVTSN